MAGVRIAVLLILNPEVRIGDIAVKDVLPVFGVGLKIGGLNLFTDKLGIFRDQIAFEELQITFRLLLRELLALDLLFQDVEQMDRVRGDLGVVKVKHARQYFEGEAGGQTVHPFVDAGVIAVLLIGFRFRVGVFQAFTVVHAHFGVNARVFRLFQPRQYGEARQRLQGPRGARRVGQLTVVKQFFVDTHLFGDTQAIRHLDDIHAVEESLVVFVITEGHPFGFVGVGENNAVKRQGRNSLGSVIVAFLRGGQQRMQHLDRRFKHLDELHNPLVGAAQGAGVAVGVRIVLGIMLQFTNIHFTDQRGDILVILITRFCLGDGNLLKDRGPHFDHAEFGDVATELVQAFCRPRRHDGAEITGRHAILFIEICASSCGLNRHSG
ncbi:Uncharacterised protein [Raoultella ornithinolytica]|nr:Uncharacterised protein [Raoultella ornithinolytica]